MKNFLILLLLLSVVYYNAQEFGATQRHKPLAGTNFLEQIVVNPTLPDLEITTANGGTGTLLEYLSASRRLKTKPFLLMSTYTFCGGCLNIFKAMADAGLPEKYDVLMVVELTPNDMKGDKLKDFLKREKVMELAKRYPLVLVEQGKFSALYNSSATPMFLFTDPQLRPYYSFTSLDMDVAVKQTMEILKLGEAQSAKREKVWLGGDLFPVAPGSEEAIYYYSIEEKGNRGKLTMGGKNYLQKMENYVITDDQLIKDGNSVNNHVAADESGSVKETPYSKVNYKMGKPTHAYKSYHANGKLAEDYPLNGIYKAYDEAGDLTAEGPVKNGLGEGIFNYYKGKEISSTKTYREGKLVN